MKINGKCTAITRGLSQALLLQSSKSFLSNLKTSAKIYERVAQGKQISKREEREVFAFSKLLSNFERQLDSTTNSLPSSLIHNKCYKTLDDLSSYIAGVKGDFAIHLVTSNHVVAVYRTGDNYAYFDSNAAFISGLESIDQLIEIVEKGTGYKVGEKGFLVEHFNIDRANNQLSDKGKRVLTKEIKTERQLLAEQDEKFGPIKSMVNRVQLYDFGTKIHVEGSVPLLINADMNLSSKKFQDHLDKKEVIALFTTIRTDHNNTLLTLWLTIAIKALLHHSDYYNKGYSMAAREYLDSLKNSKDMEGVVQATKAIPFIGCKREIEEAEQTRKPLLELIKGTINFILTTASLTSASRLKSQLPKKADDKPRTCLNDPTVDNQPLFQAISF